MLLTGPDLLANLVGVILRFRQKMFPISANIEGMYMQVSIRPQDRQFLRFLWGTDDPEMYEYVRHAMSSGQNARLPALITLFRHAPKTTHLTTRPFSASFTKVFIWMTFTYLQTPSQKPSSTWKIYAVCYKKGGFNLNKMGFHQ